MKSSGGGDGGGFILARENHGVTTLSLPYYEGCSLAGLIFIGRVVFLAATVSSILGSRVGDLTSIFCHLDEFCAVSPFLLTPSSSVLAHGSAMSILSEDSFCILSARWATTFFVGLGFCEW